MPFDPQSHFGKCLLAAMYAQEVTQLNPPAPVTTQGVVTLGATVTALGLSCIDALNFIVDAGAAPNYRPEYLALLGNALTIMTPAVAAMVGQMSNGAAVATAATTIVGMAAAVHDPLNLGLPWPPTPVVPVPPAPPTPPQRPHWMADCGSMIGGTALASLVLPGTHDSATYAINRDSMVAPSQDIPAWVNAAYALPFAGPVIMQIIANWSRTQALDTTAQLNAGIRYFDLRVVLQGGVFYTVHGMYGSPLTQVVNSVASFLAQNTKEVVILDFNHLYGITDHAPLIQMLISAFGDKLAPKTYSPTSKLNDLWATGRQVIVTYADAATANAYPQIWPQSTISSPWPNTDNQDTLKSRMDGYLTSRDPNKLFVLQGILTPTGSTIGMGVLPGNPGSIADLATPLTPQITTWVQAWRARNLNIVIVDWFTASPNYVDTLIQLNLWKGLIKSVWSTNDIGQGPGAVSYLIGDVNADGKAEVIQPWANGGSLGMIVYGWNGSAMTTLWSTNDMGQGPGAMSYLIGDVNGDGKAEIIQPWANGGSLGMIVYGWNGSAMTTLWSTNDMGQGPGAVAYLIGDINGDKRPEVIQLWANCSSLAIILYGFRDGGMATIYTATSLGQGPGAVAWLIGDVDGDGKAEIIQLWANGGSLGMIVYGWNGTAMTTLWSTSDMGQGPGAVSWLIGDVNGDGRAEILQQWANGGSLAMIVYGWTGTAMTTLWTSNDMGQGPGAVSWLIGDVGGDRKADVVQPWANGGSLGMILYSYATS